MAVGHGIETEISSSSRLFQMAVELGVEGSSQHTIYLSIRNSENEIGNRSVLLRNEIGNRIVEIGSDVEIQSDVEIRDVAVRIGLFVWIDLGLPSPSELSAGRTPLQKDVPT